MKVLLSWLREFAPLTQDAKTLGNAMSDLGMAVEEMDTFGGLESIVVAKVLETRAHPQADRIQLVDVDAGDGEALKIVCGAFNMQPGDLIPLATLGTVMPNGMEIARRKMRGEWSNGMLCSSTELGLGADASGIMILPPDLELGAGLMDELGLTGDVVYDLEINPNRPDAMSMVGVARDLAGRMGVPFAIPDWEFSENSQDVHDAAKIVIKDPDLCRKFTARVVRDVHLGPSPVQRQIRLTLAGMRPISNIVDASNYVMLELGIPNHTYDLALVPDGELRVARSPGGETVTTLDDIERTTAEGDAV
ncbi:MAG: YtpR family tRNA-binding protein, partial [Acidimicrobiales bacterium]